MPMMMMMMKKNCVSSWLFTKIIHEMHGQQNIKFHIFSLPHVSNII